MLQQVVIESFRPRQLFSIHERAFSSIRHFYYQFIMPNIELIQTPTNIDVNQVIPIVCKESDIKYAIKCTIDLLMYMTGS